MRGFILSCISLALSVSPSRYACVILCTSFGTIFEAVDIQPAAPRAIIGIVISSFPEYTSKLSEIALDMLHTCEMSPLASLMPMMLG